MATYYLDVSASNNGDGLAPTQAASDGAEGAFNNFATLFAGTPRSGVTLAAGDVIWVRTSASSVNLSFVMSASLTSSSAGTTASPITLMIDNLGEKWVGDSGVFTVTNPTTSEYTVDILAGFSVISSIEKGIIFHTNYQTNGGNGYFLFLGNAYHKNICHRTADTTNNVQSAFRFASGVYENISIDVYGMYCNALYGLMTHTSGSYNNAKFVNLTIDYTNCTIARLTAHVIFNISSYSNDVEIYGFTVIGGLETTYIANFGNGGRAKVFNAKVQQFQNVIPYNYLTLDASNVVRIQGYNGNVLDTITVDMYGITSWRISGVYPTLNAVLPTGDGWSYRYEPSGAVGRGIPAKMATIVEFYKSSSAQRTITLEFLLPNAYGTPTDKDFYIVVGYQDDTDISRVESGMGHQESPNNLSSGSPLWNYTVIYTEAAYAAWKITLQTTEAIKQNTPVYIDLFMRTPRITSSDMLFIDPAVLIA
jgi:hypothetical protein